MSGTPRAFSVLLAGVALPSVVQAQEAGTAPLAAQPRADQTKPSVPPAPATDTTPPAGQPQAAGTNAASGEIIVTAQKRSEKLTDVPMSITAVTGESLVKQGITSAADLERIAPGFTYQPTSRAAPVFTIRGIGFYDNSISNSPAVTVYLDQVPLPYSVMTTGVPFDLERVEVLKGPQGTLFGQNSTGGAVNYVAAKPTPGFSYGALATYGRFNEADFEAFLSGPLSDTLRIRVAGRGEFRDGWQRAYTVNATNGRQDLLTGRFLLDWRPSSTVKFELNVNGWRDRSDSQASQYVAFTPTNPRGRPEPLTILPGYPLSPVDIRSAEWDHDKSLRRNDKFYQLSLRGDVQLARIGTFTSITAYSDYKANTPSDSDGVSFEDIFITTVGYLRSFSQELRLNGTLGRLKWLIGGNVQIDRTLDNEIIFSLGSNQSAVGLPWHGFSQHQKQDSDTWGPFVSLEYGLTNNVTLIGAMRYSNQKRNADGCLSDVNGTLAATFSRLSTILSGSPTVIPTGACVTLGSNFKPVQTVLGKLDEDNISWKGGVNWKPQRDLLLYANVTRGYKSGAFDTLPAIRDTQLAPVPQETVLAYEAGMKATLVDHRITISGAGFFYDYSKKQLTGYINVGPPFGTLPGTVSIPSSSVKGAELEISGRPFDELTLMLGGTYVDSKVKGHFITPDPYGLLTDIHGEQFPNTPTWQFVGDAEYDYPLAGGTRLFLGGGFRYRSSSYAAFGRAPQFLLRAYGVADARAGVEFNDGRIRAFVWGKNIFNKRYLTSVNRPIDTTAVLTGMPATFGITVGYHY